MYQDDFYQGPRTRQNSPKQRPVYKTSIRVESPTIYAEADPRVFCRNKILLDERRHSFNSADNGPVYGRNTHRQIKENAARISYTSYIDGEYMDESVVDDEQLEVIDTNKVVRNLTAIGRFLEMLQGLPLPRLSLTTSCICFIIAIFISPRPCAQNIIYPAFRLSFGTLYPAYASYKAVRTKNVKEYVKWMMYWIVYALFTCTETFTDIFLSWFPFYYEVKVVIVLWLLSPATKGSSTLYRKFVHPMLTRREQEIDEYLNQAKERGYSAVLQLGSKGVNYATNVIMQTAIKTFHGINTNSNSGLRMLPSSQSDDAIYTRSVRSVQESDHTQWLTRSNSLHDTGITKHVAFSEDYTQEHEGHTNHTIAKGEDIGAARIRDLPIRKTRSKDVSGENNKRPKTTENGGIRGRRKLREPTPEVDVEGE
ncbi:uncharacterized protein LOC142241729 isoform X3 [Haematobia irritans]|uniref:uncharacterized protein LOC142241729 isoform X3 n=1 Tax=Haematobia irritans TaxID=7368 RepID=UPI003F4FEC1E